MAKGTYIDGFVLVVPKGKVPEYKKMARLGARVWKKHGALDFKECRGEDLGEKKGSFIGLLKPKAGETVWFSFVTYKSKAHRVAVNKKVMAEFAKMSGKLPPWMQSMQMFYGGFKVEVSS